MRLRDWLIFGALCVSTTTSAKVIDRIVAVVNDEVVTLSELNDGVRVAIAQLQSVADPITRNAKRQEILRQGLDTIVGKKLVIQEAGRRNITVSERDIDNHITTVRERQRWSETQLAQYLQAQGLTVSRFRSEIKTQMLQERVIGAVLGMKTRISDADLLNYYREQMTKRKSENEVEAAHIVKTVRAGASAAEEAAIRQESEEIANRARAGENFAELAKKYSQGPGASNGGSLGKIRRGTLNRALEETIFALKTNEIGGPVRTPYGYHVIKAIAVRPLPQPTFEVAKGELRQRLRRTRLNAEMQRWVEELKQKAFVDIRLEE
ncbi:MAG: peptidylprolyl isomerase [Myxococcota bacterium]|nr:peptidylprolyl isomerase [Myxococcota bacterium]